MSFLEFYVWLSFFSLALLTTSSLRDLFSSTFSQYGLIISWLILIGSFFSEVNKLNLLWLIPLAFLLPYLLIELFEKYQIKYSLRYSLLLTIFSFVLLLYII